MWTEGTLAQGSRGMCWVGEECRQLKLLCSGVPKPHYQHAAGTAQHPSVQLRTREGKKKAPTMSVLPLGILPLGGHRGCLPSLPGHSTLREPKTRKVLTNPAARRWKRMVETEGHPPAPPRKAQVQDHSSPRLLSLDKQLRVDLGPGDKREHQLQKQYGRL